MLKGAISRIKSAAPSETELYVDDKYIDYKKCYNSFIRHIIQPNVEKYDIDIFCHGWNYDIQNDIIDLYKPKQYLFEDNSKYSKEINELCEVKEDFGGISYSLSIKKVIEMKEEYEEKNDIKYDIVMLYRYDLFLWKNIILQNYSNLDKKIYVNGNVSCEGDFHFIMNNNSSFLFKNLYDSIKLGNKHKVHKWIKNYIINFIKIDLVMDDIYPGRFQEVIRKIYDFSIRPGHLSLEQYNSY